MAAMTPDEYAAYTKAREAANALKKHPQPPEKTKKKQSVASDTTEYIKESNGNSHYESKIAATSTSRQVTPSN